MEVTLVQYVFHKMKEVIGNSSFGNDDAKIALLAKTTQSQDQVFLDSWKHENIFKKFKLCQTHELSHE